MVNKTIQELLNMGVINIDKPHSLIVEQNI